MKAQALEILHERVLHHIRVREQADQQRREDLRDFAGVAAAVALGSAVWVAIWTTVRLLLGH